MNSVTTDITDSAVRKHFLGWQCRIRQIAMRDGEGRPTSGMRPQALLSDGREIMPAMTVVLIPKDPDESTTFFQFQAKKSADPKEVYDKALQYLQATHFHNHATFRDELTAVFSADSAVAKTLSKAGACILKFEQFSQKFDLACAVRMIGSEEPIWAATYWHNRVFNPTLPGNVSILGFTPDWSQSSAEPTS